MTHDYAHRCWIVGHNYSFTFVCLCFLKGVVLSDLHLGSSWLNQGNYDALTSLLSWLSEREEVKLVVLNGDLIEMWQAMFNKELTWSNIRATTEVREVADLLKAWKSRRAGELEIWFQRGNHDSNITNEQIEELFGRVEGQPVVQVMPAENFAIPGVLFTHGHVGDLFNQLEEGENVEIPLALTPHKKVTTDLPLGYWLCRAAETALSKGIEPLATPTDETVFVSHTQSVTDFVARGIKDLRHLFYAGMALEKELTRKVTRRHTTAVFVCFL